MLQTRTVRDNENCNSAINPWEEKNSKDDVHHSYQIGLL